MTTPALRHGRPDLLPFEPFRQRAAEAMFSAIGDHLDRLTWDAGRLERWQTDRLRTLLAHARAHSPFHAERLAGVDAARVELRDLSDLPVMDKASMMERFDDVLTDPRLRRTDLEWLVEQTGDEPNPAFGDYVVLTSGGSSGTRGIFVMDADALAEFVAVTIRPGIARSLAEGGPPPEGLDAVMIAAGSPIHATAVGSRVSEGGPMRIARIPATLPFEEIVAQVRDVDPDMMMGYPSVLLRLAAEQKAGRLDLHLRALTSTSENLRPEVRVQLEDAFGLPASDLYGSTEGLVGVSAPGDEPLNFASDTCLVEPVDEHDRPVAPGETSAAVLVTNLYNTTQPLIRYRIEDRFVQQPPSPDHGHFRAVVDGRASDTLRWGDVVVHPLTITNELIHTPAIVDYIVRQTVSGVAVDVVTIADVDLEVVGEQIGRDLAAAGLSSAEVVMGRIDDVGRNPRTGKVARIVPLGE